MGERMKYLLLHGLAGNPDDWEITARYLMSHGHSWYAPKIKYFDNDYGSLSELSKQVKESVPREFLGDDSVVVGNSLGGSIALQLGRGGRSIVLVASHTNTSTRPIGRGMETLNREIERIFHHPEKLSPEKRKEYEDIWNSFTSSRKSFAKLGKIKRAIARDNLDPFYEELQYKIYAVCGANDRLSPIGSFLKLKEKYPKIRLSKIDDCGHAIPIEKPLVLGRLLRKAGGGGSCSGS